MIRKNKLTFAVLAAMLLSHITAYAGEVHMHKKHQDNNLKIVDSSM